MRMDYKSDPSGGPIQTMLDTAFGGLIAGGRSFEPWFRAATRSNLEAYSLMSRRTLAYLELPMRLSQCRSPQDFARRSWGHGSNSRKRLAGPAARTVRKSAIT